MRAITGIPFRAVRTATRVVRVASTPTPTPDANALNSLFYKSSYPLTGPELKGLLKSRQIRITRRGQDVMMHILPVDWSVPDMLWDNLAIVLNEWNATSVMRDKVQLHMSIAGDSEEVSVPLNVQVRECDWIDHA